MGERSIQEKYQAWRKCPGMNEELHNQLKAMSPDELNDSFYRSLAFGTGGLRGVLGAGENRMNLYTVSKATRGLGRYLLETCEKPSCAVSCDSRIHSRDFAELTAATLAEMGIRVYLYRTLMPTPMLSYAVRHLHTSAGVMVTGAIIPRNSTAIRSMARMAARLRLKPPTASIPSSAPNRRSSPPCRASRSTSITAWSATSTTKPLRAITR